jgi:transposase-like protein
MRQSRSDLWQTSTLRCCYSVSNYGTDGRNYRNHSQKLLNHYISRVLTRFSCLVNAVFLVDGAPWLQTALRRYGLRFQHETHGNRNVIERLYKEIKRRTDQFANHFRHV